MPETKTPIQTNIETKKESETAWGIEGLKGIESEKIDGEKKAVLVQEGKKEEKMEKVSFKVLPEEEKVISPLSDVELDIPKFAEDLEKLGKSGEYEKMLEELKAAQEFIKSQQVNP